VADLSDLTRLRQSHQYLIQSTAAVHPENLLTVHYKCRHLSWC